MAKTQQKTGMVKWDEEMAKQAEIAAGQEKGSGQFFSIQSGVLAFDGAPMPGNQMAVVILDSLHENLFYEGKYDPKNPNGPKCFALGRDADEMQPHKQVVEGKTAVAEACAGCPNNEWASAEQGNGKACKNVRRLAMISAGNLDANGKLSLETDQEHYETAVIGFLRVPVTSVKGYAAYVKQVAGALKRPPHGVVTRVRVVPDPKSQFKVVFEGLQPIPNELMGVVMGRHEEAKKMIDFPEAAYEVPAAAAPKGKRKF